MLQVPGQGLVMTAGFIKFLLTCSAAVPSLHGAVWFSHLENVIIFTGDDPES